MPTPEQITAQSKAAYGQWATQWREHATWHSKHKMKDLGDFENQGIGKPILCIANGYTFEENIETIKLLQENVDIMACDKTLGLCLQNGIRPTYVLVCDANVSYEKYLEPWKDQLKGITLFSNVCANPQWTEEKWKDIYFFVNKDIINSEVEFSALSGCKNMIPAATNVSNAMVVFLTQSDNSGRCNFFGYDKILLIGYDYSWRPDGNYYAFDKLGGGKFNYMRHMYLKNLNDTYCYSSGNLAFSAEWLEKYIKSFKLPVVQCSKETIMGGAYFGDLSDNMKYKFRRGDAGRVRKLVSDRNQMSKTIKRIDKTMRQIGKDHFYASYASI